MSNLLNEREQKQKAGRRKENRRNDKGTVEKI